MSINSIKEFKFGIGRAQVVITATLPLILGAVFAATEISNGSARTALAVAIASLVVTAALMAFYASSPDKVTVDVLAHRLVISSCRGLRRSVQCFDVSQMEHLSLRKNYSRSASEVVLEFSYGRGCARFCVNGQSHAGASPHVRKHDDQEDTRST